VTRHDAKGGVRRSLCRCRKLRQTQSMMQSRRSENAIAGHRQHTAPLVAKGDLATKCERVIGNGNILHRNFLLAAVGDAQAASLRKASIRLDGRDARRSTE